jgi:hypothetical protein
VIVSKKFREKILDGQIFETNHKLKRKSKRERIAKREKKWNKNTE